MNLFHRRTSFLSALGLAVASAASVPAQTERGSEPIALIHANVLDVRSGRVALNQTVVLRAGKIESVSPAAAPASGPQGRPAAGASAGSRDQVRGPRGSAAGDQAVRGHRSRR